MHFRSVFNKTICRLHLIYVLLCLSGSTTALFEQCNHLVKLLSGQKMYINSPYYPGQYPVGSSCRYTLLAPKDHQLKLKCNIQLNSQSTSTRCIDEIFYFNREGSELLSGSEFFCGSTNVERKSFLNRAIISYISTPSYSRSSIDYGDSFQRNQTTTTATTMKPSILASVARPDAFVESVIATAIKAEQSKDVEQTTTHVRLVASSTETDTIQATTTMATTANTASIAIATTTTNTTNASQTTALTSIAANATTTKIAITSTVNTTTTATTPPITSSTPLATSRTTTPSTTSTTTPPSVIEATIATDTSNATQILTVYEKAIPTRAAGSNATTARPTSFLSFLLASMGWRNNFLRLPLHRILTISPYRTTPYRRTPFHETKYDGIPYRVTRIVGGNNGPTGGVVVVANSAPIIVNAPSSIASPLATTYAAGGGSFSCLVETVEPPCECGWSAVPKVAGQVGEAGINEYPSMAGVISVKYNKIFCGATIIHHRYLISAAHCFRMPEAESAQRIRVVVGEHDLSTVFETLYTRIYDVESIIMHEHFVTTSNSLRNDIALLRTRIDIEWNRSVGPACLPFRSVVSAEGSVRPPMAGQRLETAGWGTTTFGGAQSTRLLKTTLDVIDLAQCKRSVLPVPSGTFCTFTPGRDTCQYDSGGALYMRDTRLYAVGIVSYGFACASNQPSVNTKVSVFMRWIKSKTPEVTYCMK